MANLAIAGGRPVIDQPYPPYITVGAEEKTAVLEVLDSGELSGFLAKWNPGFYGGKQVQALEAEWRAYYGAAHAVSVNSATSGLYAAMGAAGVGPGDEVIVSPYTMSSSCACALVYNAIPVFADLDPLTFNLSAETIAAALTPRTKAVVVVDILGNPADFEPIMDLARRHGLVVIEDAAQAYGALYHGRQAGNLAHMGVFSLNRHKTIQCGEGGMVVTEDADLAERVMLIRNHAEVILRERPAPTLVDMLGQNYRMTEVDAAIARCQLRKLDDLYARRLANVERLTGLLAGLPGLATPYVAPDTRHGYYLYGLRLDAAVAGVERDLFVKALNAEGVPMVAGYTQPVYWEPVYQQKQLYGSVGCPFSCPFYEGQVRYDKGLCPVCERLYYQELMTTPVCHAGAAPADIDRVAEAFHKVYANLDELKAWAAAQG